MRRDDRGRLRVFAGDDWTHRLALAAMLLGPLWKQRVRRVVAERPQWQVHPE